MTKIKLLSTRYPLFFLFLIVIGWYILGYIAGLLTPPVPAGPNPNLAIPMTRSFASLMYLLLVAILLWRVGWVRSAGITRLGGWQVWLVALYILIYKIPTELYAYFGAAAFDAPLSSFLYLYPFHLRSILESVSARSTILTIFIFSVFYESVYRGIVLYAFVLTWGRSRLGVLVSVVVSAILFGAMQVIEMPYLLDPPGAMLLSRLCAVLSGIWLGALVLRWGSIWPGVILHTLMVLIPIIPTDLTFTLRINDYMAGAIRLAFFEIPLAFLGIWLLLRTPPHALMMGTLAQESLPSTKEPPTDLVPT